MAGERVIELVKILEQEIVTGVLSPGERLDEASLPEPLRKLLERIKGKGGKKAEKAKSELETI